MAPGTLLARSARPTSAAWLACLALGLLAAGCGGEVVNLGSSPLEAGGSATGGGAGGGVVAHELWGVQAEPIVVQHKDVLLANPTLTASMGELYYSAQQRYGNPDPNKAFVERAVLVGTGWSPSTMLTLGDLRMPDVSSPAVSGDGKELWLGLNISGSTDIFRSLRQGDAWQTPVLVAELSSVLDDVPRPPGQAGNVMPLSSKRHGGTPALYQIYLSSRASADSPWGEPSNALLGNVDSPEFQSADGFLTDSGLELYFSSTRDGDHAESDLYVARRTATDKNFGEPEPLVDLNDPRDRSEERMPWLSPDGRHLYFASDRSGEYALYVAHKLP